VASDILVCINVSKYHSTKSEDLAGDPCLKVTKPQTIGKSPPARYLHSMEFYKDKAILIIAGGRNDKIPEIVLNDIWLLKLENMEYQQVIVQNETLVIPRHNHASALYGSKLCLFGGINEKMMLSLDCQEIEFDPEKV
jgi:hypothetical protein